MTFATWLGHELHEREWNRSELSRRIGRATSVVSRWFSGTRPDPDACLLVAQALGVSAQEVLYRAGWIENPGLDAEEGELLAIYRGIPEDRQEALLLLARSLFNSIRYEQTSARQ